MIYSCQQEVLEMFIDIKNVTKKYICGGEDLYALKNVDISAGKGEILVILGPSGSGKSTLLNILGGLDSCDSGEVLVDGTDICKLSRGELQEYRRKKLGFVFQFYDLIPDLNVYENVQACTDIVSDSLDIDEVLSKVGLTEKRFSFPATLSGGQQQRTAIARAIAKKPSLLLCDEPTGALDFESSREVLKLIQDINRTYGTTVVIITHNEAICGMADKTYHLRSGEVTRTDINTEKTDAERIEW